jgi:2-furoyl-CoA dehydrogenase FAD binding subunit
VKPPRFDYERAESAEAAIAHLAELGDEARILAGGQSLLPMLSMRLAAPAVLIDVGRVRGLDAIEAREDIVSVGATCRQASLERWTSSDPRLPLLGLVLPWIGHYQTRARGTVGGSLAHADPSAELPLAAATLGGTIRLGSARGERSVPARDFFLGALETAGADDELLLALELPVAAPGSGHAFEEVSLRRGDFAILAVAAVARPGRLVLGAAGLADAPVVREWDALAPDDLDDALDRLGREVEVLEDQHASAEYRRMCLRNVGARVAAAARAAAGTVA